MRLNLIFSLMIFCISAQALQFQKACDSGNKITIGAVGDVLLHESLQRQGYKYGFQSLWSNVEPWMRKADIFYANLEGPTAAGHGPAGRQVQDPGPVFDGYVYTDYPEFNYHPSLITDLKNSGVDILSTANNHSLDRRESGVVATLEACEANRIPCFGTRRDESENFYTITSKKNWKIAWIACTFSTNGIQDKYGLVLDCFSTNRVSQLIQGLRSKVDAVIVTPHWGDEYQSSPNQQQQNFARKWLEEGADAIIGTHPHVPQTWEKHTTSRGDEKFILYSSGNFVSGQGSVPKRTAMMLFLGLTKKGKKTWVNGVRYLPLFMSRNPLTVVASNWQKNTNDTLVDSLDLAARTYGAERIIEPGESVITNAECRN
jgi:hypothetical protein